MKSFFTFGGGKASGLSGHWKVPENISETAELFEPHAGVQVIYKHSFTCGVCLFSKTKVEEVMDEYAGVESTVLFHFVDVVKNRVLSTEIAKRTHVRHESPQVIVLRNGRVIWHASHSAIRKDNLINAIETG